MDASSPGAPPEPVIGVYGHLRSTRAELDGARQVRDHDADPEMREMAREEVARLEADETRLLAELKVLLLPRDPNDDRDVIFEIRAGAGGEEAALFAAELFRMYVRYADRHRFSVEALSLNETGIGGCARRSSRSAMVRFRPQVRGWRIASSASRNRVGRTDHTSPDRRRAGCGRRGRDRIEDKDLR
jgi:protein subunit release factor A